MSDRKQAWLACGLFFAFLGWGLLPASAGGPGLIDSKIMVWFGGASSNFGAPSDNQVIVYDAATGTMGWENNAAAGTSALLDGGTVHTDTAADAVTRGSIIYGNSTPAWDELVLGADNAVLASDGTDLAYETLTSLIDSAFSSTQGSILYRGASAWAALGPGTSGHVLKTQRAGANPQWAAESGGGGGTPWHAWSALDGIAPSNTTVKAGFTYRGGLPILTYDDTTEEAADFVGTVHTDYSGGNLTLTVSTSGATATSGDARLYAQFWRINGDVDSESFATSQTATITANGTSGTRTQTTYTFTQAQADGITTGDVFLLRIWRVPSDNATGAADNMSGDLELWSVTLEE